MNAELGMAGARAAAGASAGPSASSGSPPPQEPGLGELLEEFSRTQYRAKDGGGTSGSKVSPEAGRARETPGLGTSRGKAEDWGPEGRSEKRRGHFSRVWARRLRRRRNKHKMRN